MGIIDIFVKSCIESNKKIFKFRIINFPFSAVMNHLSHHMTFTFILIDLLAHVCSHCTDLNSRDALPLIQLSYEEEWLKLFWTT